MRLIDKAFAMILMLIIEIKRFVHDVTAETL